MDSLKEILRRYTKYYLPILKLAFPVLVGQLGMIVVGFADNIMVGRYSTEALASASFVNNLFNSVIFFCIGFTYGITPLVGALFSRQRSEDIGRLIRGAAFLNSIVTLGVMACMGVLYFFLDCLGQPSELLPYIRPYYLLYLFGMLAITLFNVIAQLSYGVRNTWLPMVIILVANFLNVAGNYLLIYGKFGFPELGLTGAGISTLITRWLCPILIFIVFFKKRQFRAYSENFMKIRSTKEDYRQLNRTSWPVALQLAFESGSFSIAAIMAGWLGAVELASFQIMVIVGTLGFCLYYSLGTSVSVLVANEAGNADCKAMRRIGFAGYHCMILLATCSTLVFWLLGKYLIGVFSDDDAVIACSLSLILPLVLYQYGDATQINFSNALRGTSHVMPMLWIAFVSYAVIGVPATYILAFPMHLGIYGIMLSFSVSLFTAGGLFLYFFMRTTRKH